jgi:cellulose biosynthesis protein BcsQ
MIERLKTQVRIGYAELDEIKFKINELVDYMNNIDSIIATSPALNKPAEQTEDYQDVLATVMTERDKYKRALEKIVNFGLWKTNNATAEKMRDIAKTTLEGGE